ncbi:FdtA/QdtA family cupin domain-containing protein [Ferrovibrio terrae]|jgi:hypothetical protein|uniref:sugar 3,4-ketoisomerase n=1 Tax=Ferrovibrio terrae TaxID=2594003 RepID=UPI0031383DCD
MDDGKSWTVVDLPVVHDPRGNLTFVEGGRQVPFDIARVYYLYDVPSGSERAGHAHKVLSQLIVAASGSFSLHLDDGRVQESIFLNRSHKGVLIGPMVWRVINNFSSGGVCLVMASTVYDESDYFRDHATFRKAAVAKWAALGIPVP